VIEDKNDDKAMQQGYKNKKTRSAEDVIEGNGFIKLDGKDHEIRQGTSIFVPAKC
jgi:glyoxylate utilization-related uncharacterized protein